MQLELCKTCELRHKCASTCLEAEVAIEREGYFMKEKYVGLTKKTN